METKLIGLFQGMFENNILTFNPGWDENAKKLDTFEEHGLGLNYDIFIDPWVSTLEIKQKPEQMLGFFYFKRTDSFFILLLLYLNETLHRFVINSLKQQLNPWFLIKH